MNLTYLGEKVVSEKEYRSAMMAAGSSVRAVFECFQSEQVVERRMRV